MSKPFKYSEIQVKIGIIDTGIDYFHPDFDECDWAPVPFDESKQHTIRIDTAHPFEVNPMEIEDNMVVSSIEINTETLFGEQFDEMSLHFDKIELGDDLYIVIVKESGELLQILQGNYPKGFWFGPIKGSKVRLDIKVFTKSSNPDDYEMP